MVLGLTIGQMEANTVVNGVKGIQMVKGPGKIMKYAMLDPGLMERGTDSAKRFVLLMGR